MENAVVEESPPPPHYYKLFTDSSSFPLNPPPIPEIFQPKLHVLADKPTVAHAEDAAQLYEAKSRLLRFVMLYILNLA